VCFLRNYSFIQNDGLFECSDTCLDLCDCEKSCDSLHVAGAGSTPLHYAACGGSAQCCQVFCGS